MLYLNYKFKRLYRGNQIINVYNILKVGSVETIRGNQKLIKFNN